MVRSTEVLPIILSRFILPLFFIDKIILPTYLAQSVKIQVFLPELVDLILVVESLDYEYLKIKI